MGAAKINNPKILLKKKKKKERKKRPTRMRTNKFSRNEKYHWNEKSVDSHSSKLNRAKVKISELEDWT